MINLNGATRKALVDFLTQLDILQTEDGCRYVLKNAGLAQLIPRIKLAGPVRLAIGNLVDFLAAWGKVEGQEALILFLFALLDEVGGDGQKFLQSFVDKLQGKQRTLPISRMHTPLHLPKNCQRGSSESQLCSRSAIWSKP